MRFELHCNGIVYHSKDLKYILSLQFEIPEESIIYKIVESKFPKEVSTSKKIETAVKRLDHGTRIILSYKDVVNCWNLLQKGKTRIELSRQYHCSTDKIRLSIEHYEYTKSQDEYENTQPYKKINLLIEK